jgi:hypothetical protein
MFFFKKNKIVLDCFTNRPEVYEFARIDYIHKFFPEWWKNLPKTIPRPRSDQNYWIPTSTMKACHGFIDMYTNSAVIPMWSDFQLKVENNLSYMWYFSDKKSLLTQHPNPQFGELFSEGNHFNRKFNTPWIVACKEDVKFSMEPMFYNFKIPNEYHIMPGVVDFKNQHGVNINMMIELKPQIVSMEVGQPLVRIRPFSERELEIKTHLVDERELDLILMKTQIPVFHGKYKKVKDHKEKTESKCPFGFGK